MDAAVNRALSRAASGGKQQQQQLVAFVAEAFQGGAHAPVSKDSALTVASAVDAPAEQLRCAALAALDQVCQRGQPDQASLALLQSAMERRLADDSLAVVAAALGMRSLQLLPAPALAAGLAKLLARLEARLQEGSTGKEEASACRSLLQQAFAQLAALAGRDAGLADEALGQLCGFAFAASRKGRRVSEAALRAAAGVAHPLAGACAAALAGLGAAEEAAGAKPPKKRGKSAAAAAAAAGEEREAWEVARGAAEQLALAAQQEPAAAAALARLLAGGPAKAQLLALAALRRLAGLLAQGGGGSGGGGGGRGKKGQQQAQDSGAGQVLATALAAAEAALAGGASLAGWQQEVSELLDADGLPLKPLSQGAVSQPQQGRLRRQLALAALQAALEAAPAPALQALFGGPAECFTRLAQLQPAEAVSGHLQLAMGKLAGAEVAPTLCQVAAAPGGHSPAVQARALAALAAVCGAGGGAAAQLPAQLPLLLAALGSAEAEVRAAAAGCLPQLAAAPGLAAPLPELLSALAAHRGLIAANASAAASAINTTLKGAPAVAVPKPAGRGRKSTAGTAAVSAAADAAGVALELASEAARAVSELLLERLPQLEGPAGLAGAAACLACLQGSLPGHQLLARALPLLSSALATLSSSTPSKQAAAQQAAVAASLAALFSPEALGSAELEAALFATLATTQQQAASAAAGEQLGAVRAAALRACTPELFAALGQERRAAALQLLLEASSADGSQQCRAAARAALEQLPVEAANLVPLLALGGGGAAGEAGQAQAKKKARRGAKADAAAEQPAAAGELDARALDRAVAALELLQWKADVAGAPALLQPLQALLRALLPVMASVAAPHQEYGAEGDEQQEAPEEQQGAGGSSAAGYAAQLALAYLAALARQLLQPGAGAGGFELGLVVALAQRAPDSAVRNAALALLALLAQQAPQDALEHVLQVRGCQAAAAAVRWGWLRVAGEAAPGAPPACSHACMLGGGARRGGWGAED